MAVTKADVDKFHEFARDRLDQGEAESLSELLQEWMAARADYQDTVEEIRRAIPDMEAGRGTPLEDVDREIRAEFGF